MGHTRNSGQKAQDREDDYLGSSESPESGLERETWGFRRLEARLLGGGRRSPFMMSS